VGRGNKRKSLQFFVRSLKWAALSFNCSFNFAKLIPCLGQLPVLLDRRFVSAHNNRLRI